MTTSWKNIVIAGVAAATATVAMSTWADRENDPAAAQDTSVPETSAPGGTDDAETRRTISVNGNGSVDVTPDIAHLEMGVRTVAEKSQDALDQLGTKSQTLVDALKGLGIAEKDIQTSGLNLWPQYSNNGRTITGYEGSVSVSVTARNLDRLGEVIDGVSAFVGDDLTLGGIWFDYDDPESVLEQARTEAIANARERAAQYAAAAGAEVGEIVHISESLTGGVPMAFEELAAADAAAGDRVAIEPGTQELSVDVSVVFEMT